MLRPFFVAHSFEFLDEEFDAPDALADQELCRALAAGRWGLHPDAWGKHEPLAVRARHDETDPGLETPVDPAWEAEHRRRPVEEPKPKPKPKPRSDAEALRLKAEALWHEQTRPREDTIDGYGWLQLDCDNCGMKFRHTLRYPAGLRPAYVVMARAMGREQGWTYITGRDRCPKCSGVMAWCP